MQIQTESKPYDTINVTPMLDLAYVLLVVFILMTTASIQGLTISMPKPSNKPITEQHELKVVQVTASGAVLLNGTAVSPAELEAQLKAAQSRDAKMSVAIKGDAGTQYAKVITVID
jgi:biopolymer transport protein ExbD